MSLAEPERADTNLSFEEALARLEAVVHDLEEGKLGLAEALARYEEGVSLLRQCGTLLERAERRIELLTGIDAQGRAVTMPFDDTATAALDPQSPMPVRRRSGSTKRRDARPNPTAAVDPTDDPAPMSQSAQLPTENGDVDESRRLF